MFQVKNARLADGSLATIVIKEQAIVRVETQSGLEKVGAGALSLDDFEGFAQAEVAGCVDAAGESLLPGLIDVHVHSRDPGDPAKETWDTLAQAAFQGGVVALCDMPNTRPPTLDRDAIVDKAQRARLSGLDFKLYLGVTTDNISQIADLLGDPSLPLCGLKVYYGKSTGGHVFSDLGALAEALRARPQVLIAFHSEDQCMIDANESRLMDANATFDRPAAFELHSAIRSSDAALSATRAVIEWAAATGHRIHIAHLSTPGELALVKAAQERGLKVTSEITPHHLLFSTQDYARLGAFLKVNPPVRDAAEVAVLGRAFGERAIDCFATDHAPHTLEEKSRSDYHACPSGLPSIDFFAPLLFKAARHYGLSWPAAVAMASEHPARIFGFAGRGRLAPGYAADWVWVREGSYSIEREQIRSRCGWSPYLAMPVELEVQGTWLGGRRVFRRCG